jgi:hypothetical protein
MSDEEYFRSLYDAQTLKTPSEMFNDWLYENYMIGNGHMLLNLVENTEVQARFLDEAGLDEDTAL